MRRQTLSILAVALAAPLAVSVATPLSAQQGTVRSAPRDSVRLRTPVVFRDSQAVRVLTTGNEAEVLRVVNELRARESAILSELRSVPLGRTEDRRELEEQLARLSREAFTMMSVLESRCLEEKATAPNGFIGLNITNEVQVEDRIVTVHRSRITSVEPGSPAERAGLAAGDRLLEIGGRDARQRFPELSGLLEPGRRLNVVVEREGRERTFTVQVAPRPQRWDRGCPQFERAIQPLRMGGFARVWVNDSANSQGERRMYVLSPSVAPTPAVPPAPGVEPAPPVPPVRGAVSVVPAAPTPPAAPVAPSVFVFGSGSGSEYAYFAGAQFRALDDGWRDVLGLRSDTRGVLVNEVAPGSAAAQAGLKVGDVVTRVDNTEATSPFVVSRLLGLSQEREVELRILRKGRPQTLTVSWGQVTPRR